MRKVLSFFLAMILLSACIPEPEARHLKYQNIVILSDLSSRIKNKRFPQKDYKEINKIIEYFKSECVKPGEKIGDKSSITFSALSEKTAVSIDLDKIKDLADKQSFINSTNRYKDTGLAKKLEAFQDTVKFLYDRITNPGLDLISVLIEKTENEQIVKQRKTIIDGIDTTFIDYDNHVYIFTDGYLEYAQKQQNSQFYFGEPEIKRLRNYCGKNDVDVATALVNEKSLGLPPYKSANNQFLNLHVFETHERDKDTQFQNYKHNMGLRDNELLEAVWRKWAKDSGFKSFEWKKY